MTTRTRSRAAVIAAATLALILAGCSDPAPEEAPATAAEEATTAEPEPTAEEPTTTEAPTPTEEIEPAEPMERAVTISCHGEDDDLKMIYQTLAEAWTASPELRLVCTAVVPADGGQHEREVEALEIAYGPGGDTLDSLDILYSICAEHMLGDADGRTPYTEGQRAEIEGALTLCPDHADAGEARGRMEAAAADDVLRDEGKIFASGTYRVGEDVPAGTYVSESDDEPFDGCYWELLDEAGNIIDNNFLNSAFRVEITVPESAFSLSVERCGEFRPAS